MHRGGDWGEAEREEALQPKGIKQCSFRKDQRSRWPKHWGWEKRGGSLGLNVENAEHHFD